MIEQISLRKIGDIYPEVKQYADAETEGNVSQMFRKLVNEALAARRTAIPNAVGHTLREEQPQA